MSNFKEAKAQEYLEWLLTPPAQRSPKTKKEWAEQQGVTARTLTNWQKMDWFVKEIKAAKGPLLAAWYGDIMGRMKEIVDTGADKDAVMAARLLMSLLELPEETGKAPVQNGDEFIKALEAMGLEIVSKADVRTDTSETSSATSEQVQS